MKRASATTFGSCRLTQEAVQRLGETAWWMHEKCMADSDKSDFLAALSSPHGDTMGQQDKAGLDCAAASKNSEAPTADGTTAEASPPLKLPEGWKVRTSKTKGKVYYENKLLKKTQWYPPVTDEAETAPEENGKGRHSSASRGRKQSAKRSPSRGRKRSPKRSAKRSPSRGRKRSAKRSAKRSRSRGRKHSAKRSAKPGVENSPRRSSKRSVKRSAKRSAKRSSKPNPKRKRSTSKKSSSSCSRSQQRRKRKQGSSSRS